MSFFKLDKSQIVKNKIYLQPKHTFVYSSGVTANDPHYKKINHKNQSSLGFNVNDSGFYGRKHVKNTSSKCIKFINQDESQLDNIEHIGEYYINNRNEIDETFNTDKLKTFTDVNLTVSKNFNNDVRFSVERIKNNYLVRDINTDKISYTKKIFEYYNKHYSTEYKNLNWGFYNYNSLNFFTLNNKVDNNTNEENNFKTHRNMLVYPNYLKENGYQTYNFLKSGSLSISFYANPNKKNKEINNSIRKYNAGCVLFIPGLISIHIVSGSNTDENSLTDKYRIVSLFGDESFKKIDKEVYVTSSSRLIESGNITKASISNDNILNFNNWHCVSISLDISQTGKFIYKLFIDGKENSSHLINVDLESSYKNKINNFLTIGNKPYLIDQNNAEHTDIAGFRNIAFSCNKLANKDYLGSYTKKHISFGNHVTKNEELIGTDDNWTIYDNTYSSYDDNNNESFALNAEIHDIRIYDVVLDEDFATDLMNFGLKNKDNLLFYLPVYYYPQVVSKKGIVNLNKDVDYIKLQDIAYNFPTNPYFTNYAGGLDISVEHFVTEFVNLVNPNIVLGGDVLGESDYKQYAIYDKDTEIDLYSQKGFNPYSIIVNTVSNDSDAKKVNDVNLNNNARCIYRNLFILPNDNGIQKQNHDFVYKNFFDSDNDEAFNTVNKYFNSEIVSLENHGDNTRFINSFFDEDKINAYRFNWEFNVIPYNTLPIVYLSNEAGGDNKNSVHLKSDVFEIRNDKYWNVSNRNYHSKLFIEANKDIHNEVYSDKTFSFLRNSSNILGRRIDVDQHSFLKTLSNPATRDYCDDITNSISSNIIYTKKITEDKNIDYFQFGMPLYKLNFIKEYFHTTVFSLSSQMFNQGIKENSFSLYDVDLPGSLGELRIDLKDDGYSGLYRSNCLTEVATWNKVGNILYKDGLTTIMHPGLSFLGHSNFRIDFNYETNIFVHELNLEAEAGFLNKSRNSSYIQDLKVNNSAFNFDEDFVYITDIHLHDENLNILAKARIANPVPKKNSDNIMFRLKMDF